jgi:hypothetical protein
LFIKEEKNGEKFDLKIKYWEFGRKGGDYE